MWEVLSLPGMRRMVGMMFPENTVTHINTKQKVVAFTIDDGFCGLDNPKGDMTNKVRELFKKYDLFERYHYKKLSDYCKKLKIEFISTPFDIEAVDMLDDLVKFYKISSSDITNFPLLKKVASKKKPIILSTGASTLKEIKKALDYLQKKNVQKLSYYTVY